MAIDKRPHREILGKQIVTKEGRKLGIIKDVTFETRTGELIHLVLTNTTPYAQRLSLESSAKGESLIPYNSIIAISDFVVVSEEDIR